MKNKLERFASERGRQLLSLPKINITAMHYIEPVSKEHWISWLSKQNMRNVGYVSKMCASTLLLAIGVNSIVYADTRANLLLAVNETCNKNYYNIFKSELDHYVYTMKELSSTIFMD